jgi:hypothetical protein
MGYCRYDGPETARVIGRSLWAAQLYVNFFQPSFKLEENRSEAAKVIKRYYPPVTPYQRGLEHPEVPATANTRDQSSELMHNRLAALADFEPGNLHLRQPAL